MPTAIQRFCPICDVAFARGDALVQCEGCGVLYHPACWHRTGRCVTAAEHQSRAVARPYGLEPAPDGALDAVIAAHPAPLATAPAAPPAPAHPRTRHNPPYDTGFAPPAPRVPRAGSDPVKAPMPRVYGSRRWLRYWYVPVAAALSAATAYAVVIGVDALVGADTTSTLEPAASTTVVSQTPLPGQATATGAPSVAPASPSSVATGVPGARFQPGQQAVVTGTGECLNIRAETSTGAPVIDCVPDGAVLTILEGPASAEGRSWWRVNIGSANGWAAEEYLRPR